MRQKKDPQINAILGEEFEKILEELGVIDDFIAGKSKCNSKYKAPSSFSRILRLCFRNLFFSNS